MNEDATRALATACAVTESVRHVLSVSTDLAEARTQVKDLIHLVRDKRRRNRSRSRC